MKPYVLAVIGALCALPVAAVPFNLDFAWTAVAGINGNSGDGFAFTFSDPSGLLKVSQLSVTLGNGMIYDLTNTGAGYLTWGAYTLNDGGAGSTITSAPIGEGLAGNRTISWNLTSFLNNVTFGYTADVDESGTCPAGIAGAICRLNVDSIAPSGFVSRGAIDVVFTVDFTDGTPGGTFLFPGAGQAWNTPLLGVTASTTYAGNVETPEPASWALGVAGLAAVAALRRRKR